MSIILEDICNYYCGTGFHQHDKGADIFWYTSKYKVLSLIEQDLLSMYTAVLSHSKPNKSGTQKRIFF